MQVMLSKKQQKVQQERNFVLLFHSSNCRRCKKQWQKILGKEASPRDKRGDTFLCVNRCGFQRPTEDGKCPICGIIVVRQPTYSISAERFRIIIDENKKLFNEQFDDRLQLINVKELGINIPIPIGDRLVFIPFEILIEFYNLDVSDRSQFGMFFESIKNTYPSYKI